MRSGRRRRSRSATSADGIDALTAGLLQDTLGRMDAPESDEALMCRYRDGDAAAFEALYARHRGGLYRFILRQVATAALAEELFQDVWLSVIGARESYAPSARFTTWLYRVARNRVIDHHRRRGVRAADDAGSDSDPDLLAGAASAQPERRAAIDGAMRAVIDGVRALPEDQRTAFLLREESGLSVAEIASVTGVNAETAKSRLRYAVAKLRDMLGEDHD